MIRLGAKVHVGLMVSISLLILGFLVIMAGDFRLFKKGYEVRVYFSYVSGLKVGAPVRLAGMEVGKVKDMSITDSKVEVVLWIEEGVCLRKDSKVTIGTLGLIGEKYIEISMGKGERIPPSAKILGEDPVSVAEILSKGESVAHKLEKAMGTLDSMLGGEETKQKISLIIENTTKVIHNLNEILIENRNNLKGTLNTLNNTLLTVSNNVDRITKIVEGTGKRVDTIFDENREDIKATCNKLRDASSRLEHEIKEISKDLRGVINDLQEIVVTNKQTVSTTISNLKKASEGLQLITKRIEDGKGPLAKLLNDEKIGEDLSLVVSDLKEFTSDLKRNPWKLLRKK
ncbi:MAG: MlaD family protein [bacterium]|nr:MlaD family protein [bacterium]